MTISSAEKPVPKTATDDGSPTRFGVRRTVIVRRMKAAGRWLLDTARRSPLTAAAITLLWVMQIVYRFNKEQLREALGMGIPPWPHPGVVITSGMTTPTVISAVFGTLALLVFGVASEKTLGSARFATVAVIVQVVSVTAGTALARVITVADSYWGTALHTQRVLSPTPWLFGTAAVASAFMPALWRRRVRAVLVAVSLTLLLYSGVISDFPRMIAVLGGLLAGQWMVFRNFRPAGASWRESRNLVAWTIVFITLGPLLAAINPDAAGPFSTIVELNWTPKVTPEDIAIICGGNPDSSSCAEAVNALRGSGLGPFVLNQLPLVITFVIAVGLSRGRRLAWWAALVVELTTIWVIIDEVHSVADLYGGGALYVLDVAAMVVPWLVAVVLLVARRHLFTITVDRKAYAALIRRVLMLFAGTGVLWMIGSWVLRHQFTPHATFWQALKAWPLRYMPSIVGDTINKRLVPGSDLAWLLTVWTGVLFWVGVIIFLWLAFFAAPDPAGTKDRSRARAILFSGGGDHLSWMTLWPGNSYYFDEETGGYVAYRVHSAVAVTVGQPVLPAAADPAATGAVADRFERYASNKGWRIAWYSVRESFAENRRAKGWHTVQVAEEAIIDTTSPVEFKGKKFQDVRTARNRAGKENIRAEWTTWAEVGPALRERIVALSEEWVADKALPEMGFTLGGLDELTDPQVGLLLALDDSDRVHGVTSWLPVYEHGQRTGWILDFMRRDPNGFRPVVEFLIAEMLLKAETDGISFVSLSGAPLAHMGSKKSRNSKSSATGEDHSGAEDAGASVLEQVLDKVGASLEPLYGFRSLAFFKSKFFPDHASWLLCYRDELGLPAIGMAVGQCYVPQVGAGQVWHVARAMARG